MQGQRGSKQQGVWNIKKPEQGVPVNQPIPTWAHTRSLIAGGIFWIIKDCKFNDYFHIIFIYYKYIC